MPDQPRTGKPQTWHNRARRKRQKKRMQKRIAAQHVEIAGLVALLRRVEWVADTSGPNPPSCPVCGGWKPQEGYLHKQGHPPDCALAALLARYENPNDPPT